MKRIPEPELMDEPAQARAYAEADFSEANTLFVAELMELIADPAAVNQVLDLGCGPADITLEVARRLPNATVAGLDGADAMLQFARERLNQAPELVERVRLLHSLIPCETLEPEGYDVVVSNSLLHHLPDPSTLWQTLQQCARPGAWIQVMDLMRPENELTVPWLVDTYAADAPEVLQRDFRNSLFAAYTLEEVHDQLIQAGLGQLAVRQISDRHLCVSGRV